MTETDAESRAAESRPAVVPRSLLRSVALPAEHGGWGLTLEPALLGLLVAPSLAGALLAFAALVAFVARTPVKLALGDRWRRRRLVRTVIAERVAAVELGVLVALVAGTVVSTNGPFWIPFVIAAPLIGVELWFDVRSRGRRLAPELAGAVSVSSVASAITLADGAGAELAAGLWLVLGARVVASIPFVREQIARLHGRVAEPALVVVTSVAAVLIGGIAVMVDTRLAAGAGAVAVVVVLQLASRRHAPPPAKVLGIQQMVLGLAVVLATAAGVRVS